MNCNVDKRRIAKNTLYLYVRMLLVLGVNFYAVRLLLKTLGVQDYGVFNIIFGFVTMFFVFNDALSRMVQRFVSYELGRGCLRNCRMIFSISLIFFVIMALLIFLFAETGGMWLVYNKLNIPHDKMPIVRYVYQLAVFVTIVKTITIPFTATIAACERMSVFAKIGVFESLGLFVSVLACIAFPGDKLLLYSVFYALISTLISLWYILYCYCSIAVVCKPTLRMNRFRIYSMGRFFSWSAWGAVANMSKSQGINLLLNVFWGVAVNTTWSISQKVSGAVAQLTSNFQTAFAPQIIKSYANKNNSDFFSLITHTSKYSFLLLWILALPILLETNFILHLWLGDVFPPYLTFYVQFALLFAVVDALNGPLWIAALANGKIGIYQVCVSLLIFLIIIFSWIALFIGMDCRSVPVIAVAVNVLMWGFRLIYLKKALNMPLRDYVKKTIIPFAVILILSWGSGCLIRIYFENRLPSVVLFGIMNLVIVCILGFSTQEKKLLVNFFRRVK